MTKKLNIKVIVVIIIALAVVVIIGSYLNRPDNDFADATINITQDDQTLKSFTLEEVKKLPAVGIEKTVVSSSKGNETGVFTGVWLADLLKEVDPQLLTGEHKFITKAVDGYASVLSSTEVNQPENVLLAYAKDNQSLGTIDDGGSGPFRIIIVEDPFGNRSARFLNEIEIK